jgi:hypothetical protein
MILFKTTVVKTSNPPDENIGSSANKIQLDQSMEIDFLWIS